jgi:hypothetical protein
MAKSGTASLTIAELREFASFSEDEQLFIERSLDVGLGRGDAFKQWAGRDTDAIRSQYLAYRELRALRESIPCESSLDGVQDFIGALVRITVQDLAQEQLASFSAYASSTSACSARVRGPGSRRRSAARQPCRRSARSAARPCCSRSAKPPRPRPRGPSASRASSRRRSRPRRPEASVLVKPVDPRAVALADRVAADLEARGHLAVLDRERLVGEGELADLLDHRQLAVHAVDRRAHRAAERRQRLERVRSNFSSLALAHWNAQSASGTISATT